MSEPARPETLARYKELRALCLKHQGDALGHVPRSAIIEQGRRLGLVARGGLITESMNEVSLIFDLLLYAPQPGRSCGIERYARSARVAPGSDDELVIEALRRTRFAIWKVERPHAETGLILYDIIRDEQAWFVDENFERSATPGAVFAMRVSQPEDFVMHCGVIVPLDRPAIEEALDAFSWSPTGETQGLADDRRFAAAIYKVAVSDGLMSMVRFRDGIGDEMD